MNHYVTFVLQKRLIDIDPFYVNNDFNIAFEYLHIIKHKTSFELSSYMDWFLMPKKRYVPMHHFCQPNSVKVRMMESTQLIDNVYRMFKRT